MNIMHDFTLKYNEKIVKIQKDGKKTAAMLQYPLWKLAKREETKLEHGILLSGQRKHGQLLFGKK